MTKIHPAVIEKSFKDLELLHHQNPIVHSVTNLVVMQTTANVLLALGASPIMAHAVEELAEIVAISHALVINIGTLDKNWVESMELAQRLALQNSKPIILDPVGAGASRYRTEVAKKILQNGVQIVRGNSSEIMALANCEVKAKGVDSAYQSTDAIACGKYLANEYDCVVVISGKTDVILDKENELFNPYGSTLFTKVTGMGCAATAVIGAFAAINHDYFNAAAHAMLIYTLTGQIAETRSKGPASFYNELLDELYQIDKNKIISFLSENLSDAS